MIFTQGDKLVIVASLKLAAMIHDERSKKNLGEGKISDARRDAHFSMECVRLVDILEKAG